MKNYQCIVTGKVQGVFYRKTVAQNASKEYFNGYVKNLPNKSVEACVSCEEERFEEFLNILRNGSSMSMVKDIQITNIDEVFTDGFEIRY